MQVVQPPEQYGFPSTSLFSALQQITIPKSYKQAILHNFWQKVVLEKLRALDINCTWELVAFPKDVTSISYK